MGVGKLMSKIKPSAGAQDSQFSSQAATPARADSTVEKNDTMIDDSPVKYLTWRSFILGLCVSMGGFIFGYSTGKAPRQLGSTAGHDANLISRSNLWLHHHERLQDALC